VITINQSYRRTDRQTDDLAQEYNVPCWTLRGETVSQSILKMFIPLTLLCFTDKSQPHIYGSSHVLYSVQHIIIINNDIIRLDRNMSLNEF